MKMVNSLKKAFQDMKESATAQHEVDKAQFEQAKAESRANFEENKEHNTLARAKAESKKNWDETHVSPAERNSRMQAEREAKIAEAHKKTAEANARYEVAKK